ncbi:acyltransferase [Candidatus Daviesbacteria bacterium]|nr:acyltransferase [Candidatus Daviesbacteria bacterium]
MQIFRDKAGRPLTFPQATHKGASRAASWFLDLELLLLTWTGLVPLHWFRLLAYWLAGIQIGQGSRIHIGAKFFNPSGIKIGRDTIIGDNVFLDGRAPLTIGNHVDIASQVLIYNSQHDIDDDEFGAVDGLVDIGDYVFIGPRAIILPGVKIGQGAVVAAGAVVADDVLAFTVVGGVPAKLIKERNLKDPHYVLGRARLFQ